MTPIPTIQYAANSLCCNCIENECGSRLWFKNNPTIFWSDPIGAVFSFSSRNRERAAWSGRASSQAMDGEVCKMEGETRGRRKGKERAENQERNQQQRNFFLEDESEEHHFNPFLPSSPNPNCSNSSLPKTQIRLPFYPNQPILMVYKIALGKGWNCIFWYFVLIGVNLTKKRTEVSRARWIEEIGMGEVIEKKGSLWGTTGVIRNSKLYCHIEEIG